MNDRFAMRIPDGWTRYDLTGGELATVAASETAAVEDPELRAGAEDGYRQAGELLRAMVRDGALAASGLIEMHDDGLLMAFAGVFGTTLPEGYRDDVALLLRPDGAARAGAGRTVTAVELPEAGAAVRVTSIERVPVSDDWTADMLTVNTFVAVPDRPGEHLVISCSTPNLQHADALTGLFDAITATFRFV
ncbi:hypothetical protein J2S43_001221 [Catenuloplanes nepalensis]|uniref:Uncharacterized protein n=1 Tax=Catenuloplanes nepalensis TaxID=587533 RepID=A0ABT9MMV0_9ACTN|nr:hypothetical protein [Catenuloplanes nepalensis]MDP9792709.1 hypothetical protein [Catenuloplanes nepalensis]